MTDWRSHLIEDDAGIARVLDYTKRIAVLGIKIESSQPANYVPAYAKRVGLEIVPVPVYYPDATEILGERVYRKVSDVPGDVDLVNVFRDDTVHQTLSAEEALANAPENTYHYFTVPRIVE